MGYRCLVETPQKATCLASESFIGTEHTSAWTPRRADRIAAAAENALPSLEFRGVVVENGTVLRHWRQEGLPRTHGIWVIQGLEYVVFLRFICGKLSPSFSLIRAFLEYGSSLSALGRERVGM